MDFQQNNCLIFTRHADTCEKKKNFIGTAPLIIKIIRATE